MSLLNQITQRVQNTVEQKAGSISVSGITLPDIAPENLGKSILSSVNGIQSSVTNYSTILDQTASDVVENLDRGLDGIVDNIVVGGVTSDATTTVLELTNETVPDDVLKQVNANLSQGDVTSAAADLKPYSGETTETLEQELSQVDVSVAGQITVTGSQTALSQPYVIGEDVYKWNGAASTDYPFSYVSSTDELLYEIAGIKRQVTEVVVHWTDTYTNADLSAQDIHANQIKLGHDGIGYHYVIRRDGSLQRGRPVNVQGDHAPINGHDQYSIAIAFVGGINAPTQVENAPAYRSAASLTRAQFTTFNQFVGAFYRSYPGGQVIGHNNIDPLVQDPGFDVIDYCLTLFGKVSLFTEPENQSPFEPQQITQAQQTVDQSLTLEINTTAP